MLGSSQRVCRLAEAGGPPPAEECGRGDDVASKAVISLTTGLEDAEKVTVAFLVAVAAAEQGRPTLMFRTKEAVRLALDGGGPARGPVTRWRAASYLTSTTPPPRR
jgi:hypothetical protein